MSIKLTDTQLVVLSAAAQRKDLFRVAPPTLKGATAQKVASKLISAGFVKEVKACEVTWPKLGTLYGSSVSTRRACSPDSISRS